MSEEIKCDKCGKKFSKRAWLKRHAARKTPCNSILEVDELPEEKKKLPHKCRFCGRVMTTSANLIRHVRQSCKIAPRNGDTSGMDKLYDHVVKKQEEKHKAELQAVLQAVETLRTEMKTMKDSSPSSTVPALVEHKEVKNAIAIAKHAVIDQSTKNINKTNVTINIFGAENTSHITQRDVLGIFRSLGPIAGSQDLAKVSDRVILSMAMMIYSDEKHPENITCYLPSKKGKEALVHSEAGWEVMPVSLTLSPMASRSVDELFKKQPWAGLDGIAADANLDEPSKILIVHREKRRRFGRWGCRTGLRAKSNSHSE